MSTRSAISCNHANEMPVDCPCDADCYCKEHSCKKRHYNKQYSDTCQPEKQCVCTSRKQQKLKLFYVQDLDRPLYVIARSWHDAVTKWKEQIAFENNDTSDDIDEPSGVSLIADHNDLLLTVEV